MSVSLYRKYRPQNFSSVVGQKPAISVLTNALTQGRPGHAYLFSGSRGCGKTSIARIFAKALNCLDPQGGYEPCDKCANCEAITAGESLDVIEIDGASNNGVENIRGLRENIALSPFSSKHKIYIIDEVHMLSQGAFNALLKTLEEPPEHAVFILATTEPHKVPVTIRSRCQHIPFHSISPEDIHARLGYVCEAEGVGAEDEALWEIARQAEGALRDALSLLEQVIAAGEVSLANVEGVLGAGSRPAFERWLRTLRTGSEEAYTGLKAMFDAGASGVRVFEEMFSLVRNLWLVSKWKGIADSLGLSQAEKRFLLEEVGNWKPDRIYALLNNILRSLTQARQRVSNDVLLGMFMLSLEAPPQPASPLPLPTSPDTGRPLPTSPDTGRPYPTSPYAWEEQAASPALTRYDPALKAELLSIAHDNSFTVWCALFDVSSYRDNNAQLILDVAHPYCYDRLRLPQNTSLLQSMFGSYGQVVLRHDGHDTPCREFSDVLAGAEAEAPEPLPMREPMPEFGGGAEPEHEAVPETRPLRRERSEFDVYRRALTSLGANPELLFLRSVDEEIDNDNDLMQEGDAEE